MRQLFAGALCAGVLLVTTPALADDITIKPDRVEPGGQVTITLDCSEHTAATAQSEAFGTVKLGSGPSATTDVIESPGEYVVSGRCAPDATPLNDAALVIVDAGYPSGGAETGDGSTSTRAVSPVVSVLVGLAVAGAAVLLIRRGRARG